MLLERLVVRIDADVAALSQGLGDADRKVMAFGQSMQSVGRTLTVGLTAPLAALGGVAVKMASDAEESANKFNVVMGSATEDVRARIEGLAATVPLTTAQMENLAAGIQDMLVPMGLVREEAAGMSVDMVQLAGDLGSFNNVDPARVLEAMKSALAGSSEPMRQFGVDTRVARLEAIALEEGLIGAGEAMDQTAMAQAVMIAIQRDSSDAMGDAARTVDSTANQFRFLGRNLKELGITIGTILIPAITPLVAGLASAVDWVGQLDPAVLSVGVAFAAAAAAMGPVLVAVGSLIAAAPLLTAGLAALGVSGGVVFGAVAAFGALAAAGVALVSNWEIVKYEVGRLVDGIRDSIVGRMEEIAAAVKAPIEAVTGFFKTMYDKVVGNSYVPDMMDEIAVQFRRLPAIMVKPAKDAASKVDGIFASLGFGDLGKRITSMLDPREILSGLATGGLSTLISAGTGLVTNFIGGLLSGGPSAQELREAVLENVRALEANTKKLSASDALELPGNEFGGFLKAIQTAFAEVFQFQLETGTLGGGFPFEMFVKKVDRILGELGLSFTDLTELAKQYGIDLADGAAAFEQLEGVLQTLIPSLEDFFGSFQGGFGLLQKEFELLDITDPAEKFSRAIDFVSGLVSEEFAGILQGLNADNIDAFIGGFLEALRAGTFNLELLGELSLNQFLEFLGFAETQVDDFGKSMEKANAAVRNAPSGFKVSLARFNATVPDGMGGRDAGGFPGDLPSTRGGGGFSRPDFDLFRTLLEKPRDQTINFYGDLSFPNVRGARDAEGFVGELQDTVVRIDRTGVGQAFSLRSDRSR